MSLKVRRFTPVWRDRDGNRMFAVMHRVETRRGAVNLASMLSADMLVAGWVFDCTKEIVVDRQGKIHRCPNVAVEHARLGPISPTNGHRIIRALYQMQPGWRRPRNLTTDYVQGRGELIEVSW